MVNGLTSGHSSTLPGIIPNPYIYRRKEIPWKESYVMDQSEEFVLKAMESSLQFHTSKKIA